MSAKPAQTGALSADVEELIKVEKRGLPSHMSTSPHAYGDLFSSTNASPSCAPRFYSALVLSALHLAIPQQRLNYHRALSSVILAATAPFFRPLRDFPPNNRVGRDTRQNRALVAIIQTLGVHNDTFVCEKEWSSIFCTRGNFFQLTRECCPVYLSVASWGL